MCPYFQAFISIVQQLIGSSAFWSITGAIIGSIITARLALRNTLFNSKLVSFSNLMGIKKLIKQLYVSRFEALIFSDYHEAKWKSSNHATNIDYEEAKRWMLSSEALVLEIARAEKELANVLGTIVFSFKLNSDEKKIVNEVIHHPVPNIKNMVYDGKSVGEMESIKIRAVADLQAIVDGIFDAGIDKLIKRLEDKR